MAKTVNVNSVFSTVLSELQSLKGQLEPLQGKYEAGMSAIGGVTVNFGTWSDDASTKFQAYYSDTLNPGINSIDSDVSGGGFQSLLSTTDSLIASISTCNTLQTDIKVTKKEMQTTPKTVRVKTGTKKVANNPDWRPSYQGGSNTDTGFHYEDVYETQANPDYTALEEALAQFEEDLEAEVENANSLFATLASISFSGSTGGGTGGGAAGTPATEGTPTPTSSGDDGGSEGEDAPTEPITVENGDMVKVGDDAVVFVGTLEDGTCLYKDPGTSGRLYYQDADGNLHETNATYDWFQNNGANVNGEVVYPGDVTREATFDGDAPFEFVSAGDANPLDQSPSAEEDAPRTPKAAPEESSETPDAGDTPPEPTAAPEPAPVETAAPVTVVAGDTVQIGDYSAVYVCTAEDGTNLFQDPNTSWIYYQTPDGEMHKSNCDYEWFLNNGANVNGNVLYYGDTKRSIQYENGNDVPFDVIEATGDEPYDPYTVPSSE